VIEPETAVLAPTAVNRRLFSFRNTSSTAYDAVEPGRTRNIVGAVCDGCAPNADAIMTTMAAANLVAVLAEFIST
jgi:hypothetical protein